MMQFTRFTQRALARFGDAKNIPHKCALPSLNYGYSELEPVMSKDQLELHHKKHHQTYVNNLNAAIDGFKEAEAQHNHFKMSDFSDKIKFNLGGHLNHSIFWQNLAPIGKGGGQLPNAESAFSQQVIKQFGSFEKLIDEFTKKTVPIQGSGWGWLAWDQEAKALRIMDLPNQETLAPKGLTPILTIDVWEHAYYVDYKNMRADYVKQIWKIVNWQEAEKRFNSLQGKTEKK